MSKSRKCAKFFEVREIFKVPIVSEIFQTREDGPKYSKSEKRQKFFRVRIKFRVRRKFKVQRKVKVREIIKVPSKFKVRDSRVPL